MRQDKTLNVASAVAPGPVPAAAPDVTRDAASCAAPAESLLEVRDLSIGFYTYEGRGLTAPRRMVHAVEHLDLTVCAGEVLALVGASGSGKSLLADAVMGLFAENAEVTGTVRFAGEALDARAWALLRGHEIAFVPQSVESLDPLMRVGVQLEGMARDLTREEARRRRQELFARYRLDESVAAQYPFELSGGMARRALLIGALMNEPRLLVADEPTPGLDQALALHAVADLRAFADAGGAVLLITHDIELALRVADRLAVFRAGTVVEEASVVDFASPERLRHPFSRALMRALPERGFAVHEGHARAALQPAPRPAVLEARGLRYTYPCGRTVIADVGLTVHTGECLAICAPSGRGKTTLCRLLAGHLVPEAGTVALDGAPLPARGACPVQLVGQHPERMMDPLLRVRESLAEALGLMRATDVQLEEGVGALMDALGVRRAWLDRFPLELSGGELQRCCIVRALACGPRFLVCDEMTTMLDAVSQAQVWRAVMAHAARTGMGIVFVSHSPALIERVATRRFEL